MTLSIIEGVDEEDDYEEYQCSSLVNEFKIKDRKLSSLQDHMLFLPTLEKCAGVRVR